MIPQSTIQITNAIQLSTSYLNRFFSKIGPIQKITKNIDKNLVYIQFTNQSSIQKSFKFIGRILDKKPIMIRKFGILEYQEEKFNQRYQKQKYKGQNKDKDKDRDREKDYEEKYKDSKKSKKHHHEKQKYSLPYHGKQLHNHIVINNSNKSNLFKAPFKIPIRSSYRLIQPSDLYNLHQNSSPRLQSKSCSSSSNSQQQQTQIRFISNPLQGIKSKSLLWKIITHQLQKNILSQPQIQYTNQIKQLILSSGLSYWLLVQLKLHQIYHLLLQQKVHEIEDKVPQGKSVSQNNQMIFINEINEKSKYIEPFVQQIFLAKINILKQLENYNNTMKIINNTNKYKTISICQKILQINFDVIYPEQMQEQCKLLTKSNQKMCNFIKIITQKSSILGKIYHELYTNSMILVDKGINDNGENKSKNQEIIIKRFLQNELEKYLLKNKDGALQSKGLLQQQQKQLSFKPFTGFLENNGSYIFHFLSIYKTSNSTIWLQLNDQNEIRQQKKSLKTQQDQEKQSLKIQSSIYPQFFSSNLIYQNLGQKLLQEKSFYNIYSYQWNDLPNKIAQNQNIQQQKQLNQPQIQQSSKLPTSYRKFIKKQSQLLKSNLIVFQQDQFSLQQMINNTLNYVKHKIAKMEAEKVTDSQIIHEENQWLFSNKHGKGATYHNVNCNYSNNKNNIEQIYQFRSDNNDSNNMNNDHENHFLSQKKHTNYHPLPQTIIKTTAPSIQQTQINQPLVQKEQSQPKYEKLHLTIVYMTSSNFIINEKSQKQQKSTNYSLAFNILIDILQQYNTKIKHLFMKQLDLNFLVLQVIKEKQEQHNIFKLESFLMEYLDSYFVKRAGSIVSGNLGANINTTMPRVIASLEHAEKIAEKILDDANGHKLFGYGYQKKKYIGSELWRLYQKAGSRRVKQKIQEYSVLSGYKKVKTD